VILAAILAVGGGRRLLRAWRARVAVARLERPDVTPEILAGTVEHGRAALEGLFQRLGPDQKPDLRRAAWLALSALWVRDELIAEEEKALVRRGFEVTWRARKRYPRGITTPIPVSVRYGAPFLSDEGPGIRPENLEWSHRIVGARRASLEVFSPWSAGEGRAEFTIVPQDFETNGPHRLVLQARVRTAGLTDSWELELPHTLFSFEFDPQLKTDALFTLPDDARASEFGRRVRLVPTATEEAAAPAFLLLNDEMAVRGEPALEVSPPLPCDLTHTMEVTFEGVPGWFRAGAVVVCGGGVAGAQSPGNPLRFPLELSEAVPRDALERPGTRRVRVRLTPDPDRAWGEPDVRSLWPGLIETAWVDAEVVRR
jgi:hypothetical protein